MKFSLTTLNITYIVAAVLICMGTVYWLSTPTNEELPAITSASPKVLPVMTVVEKKARFKEILLPAINKVYADLIQTYNSTLSDITANKNQKNIEKLYTKYKVSTNEALLRALKPSPKSIALAQAAMESSWATSRFFLEGNNVFGVWSFDENEPRIAAGKHRGNKTIWVKKYSSVEASIVDYYLTLARGSAFDDFRLLKMKTDDPFQLVKKLDRYSEKGALYGEELAQIIKFNKFTLYDE